MNKQDLFRITVLIITYNQQNVIGRALESVLRQKQYGLYEIVICDDASSDNNWDVICSFQNRYPNIIRAYRNDTNLGIFGNMEKMVTLRGNGELFHILAGDDEIGENLFEKTQQFIFEHKIDVINNALCFYSDYKVIDLDGKEYIFRNNKVLKSSNLFGLAIRQLINNRSITATSKVLDRYTSVILNEGITLSEVMFDRQMQLHADQSYYFSTIGNIYYSGIGVSTKANSREYLLGILHAYSKLPKLFSCRKIDEQYIRYIVKRTEFKLYPTIWRYFLMWYLYISSVSSNYGKHFIRDIKTNISILLFSNKKINDK